MITVDGSKKEVYSWTGKFSLEGKTALLSGAGSGLCREVSKGMAMSGANVVLMDRNAETAGELERELCEAGLSAVSVAADVTNADDVRGAVGLAVEKFGRLDIMVNAAGITRRMPLENFDEDAFDAVINVNLKGTFLMTKYAGAQMLKQGAGSIINFGSLGSTVAIPESSAYCASKGGVAMLTKTAAVEWASRGVRVNMILPGTYTTPLLKYCIEKDPAYGDEILKRFPIGRFGDPEELVGAIIYLASDASSYTTGLMLAVDGGCTAF